MKVKGVTNRYTGFLNGKTILGNSNFYINTKIIVEHWPSNSFFCI